MEATVSELSVLRIIAVKGRATPDAIAESLGLDPEQTQQQCAALAESALAKSTASGLRLTTEGRERMAELLQSERARIDHGALAALYERFCEHNSALKEIITAWQVKEDSTPNDHTDGDYDAEVIRRLTGLHAQALPVVTDAGVLVPRLAHYAGRLQTAHDRIAAGEHSYVARPIIDSYHSVWFELHEDLIALMGRTRADEATAGRAQ